MIAALLFLAAILFAWGLILFAEAVSDWLYERWEERQGNRWRVLDLRRRP